MARKTIQDKKKPIGELLGLRSSPDEEEKILKAFDGIPPLVYWLDAKTDDQKQYFIDVKGLFDTLREELKLYFSGQGADLNYYKSKYGAELASLEELLAQDPDNEGLAEAVEAGKSALARVKRLSYALQRKYLALYDVFQYGWSHIKKTAKSDGENPVTLADIGVHTPADALVICLGNDSAFIMAPSVAPYYRFSPTEIRSFSRMTTKASRGELDEKKLKRFNAKLKTYKKEHDPYKEFENSLLRICDKHSKKDKELGDLLKTYRKKNGVIASESATILHPRRKMKGDEWFNGIRKPLARG